MERVAGRWRARGEAGMLDRTALKVTNPIEMMTQMTESGGTSVDEVCFETSRLRARPLKAGDEVALQSVFAEAGDYFLSITGRPEPDADAAVREIEACGSVAGREIALLTDRETGESVGAIGWWEGSPEPDLTLLGMMLIVPGSRGRGLAREALHGLEGHLEGRGVRALRSAAGAGDARVQDFLKALGFEPLDERKHVSLDRGRMMIALFEKTLG